VRVVIGEDLALMREGLQMLLEQDGFEVVGLAADGEELLREARAQRPDVVVADVRMPPSQSDEGLRAALAIRAELPATAIVVLSQHVERHNLDELLESAATGGGGIGYLLKQRVTDGASFCADVRRVCAGATLLDRELVAALLARADNSVSELTPRQREVLALVAEGRSNAAIAARLVLSEGAVVKHVSHIYERLDLPVDADDHRRVLAVNRYLAR
jgi:DNA-binding NarL/FixJ family response regulator